MKRGVAASGNRFLGVVSESTGEVSGSRCFISLDQPAFYELQEPGDIRQLLEIVVDLVPIELRVIMYEDIPETGQWGQVLCEIHRKNTGLPQSQYGFIIIPRFFQILYRNDPIGDIDDGLCENLKVSLDDVLQVGVGENFFLRFLCERI